MSDSFATPWTAARQTPLSRGFLKQEYWSGLPFPSPGDLPDPGIEPALAALADGCFTTEPPGKPSSRLVQAQDPLHRKGEAQLGMTYYSFCHFPLSKTCHHLNSRCVRVDSTSDGRSCQSHDKECDTERTTVAIFVEMDHEEPQTKKHPQISWTLRGQRFLSAVTQQGIVRAQNTT